RTTDGFELAEVDLELRGEGNLLAARQSGIPDLRHARLSRHRRLAMRARQEALRHLDADPQLRSPASELMLDQARRLFGEEIGWLTRARRHIFKLGDPAKGPPGAGPHAGST